MYYIKYMPFRSSINASRNLRELSVARECGMETIIFSNDTQNNDEKNDVTLPNIMLHDGTVALNASMSRVKRYCLIIRNYLSVWLKTFRLPYGVWSCHDLQSLRIAWIMTRFRKKKPILIYDSHEFEIGRNVTRSKRKLKSVMMWEKFLINKSAFTIVVNETIANQLCFEYKLDKSPIVIRSTPLLWTINDNESKDIRRELLESF